MTDLLRLETRLALPEGLRLLLADYPRASWTGHRNFDGLVAFWLERHLDFRTMLADFRAETEAVLDHQLDPEDYAARLARRGNRFLQHLHGHHQIEDAHFFPQLARMEPRIAHGFDLLEADHQAIDGHLAQFAATANQVLQNWQDKAALSGSAAGFQGALEQITRLLDRHLTDEEELVVPVILRDGPERLG